MYISNKEINIFNKHHTDSTITTLTYQYSNFLVSEIMLLHVFEYVSYHLKSNKMCYLQGILISHGTVNDKIDTKNLKIVKVICSKHKLLKS